jgi:hypothetical protein
VGFTIGLKSKQLMNMFSPTFAWLVVKVKVMNVKEGGVDGKERKIAPPLPDVVLQEHDSKVQSITLNSPGAPIFINTAPPFSLFNAIPLVTVT